MRRIVLLALLSVVGACTTAELANDSATAAAYIGSQPAAQSLEGTEIPAYATFAADLSGKGIRRAYKLAYSIFATPKNESHRRPREQRPGSARSAAARQTSDSVPADIARFFAAVKWDSKCPNDTTCIYLQTFPNGATRQITLRVDPNRQYTPTPDEIANTAPGSAPIYAFKYASNVQADGTVQIDLNYFVAKEGLPKGPAKMAQASSLRAEEPRGSALVQLAALRADEPRGIALMQLAAGTGATDGAGISWGEIGKEGADVGIGSLIDYAKERGIRVGPLGSIFALASALSDVTEALDLSKQNRKWLSELDSLEKCAANPTNQLAKSDPNYSKNTVAMLQSARRELKLNTAVRFLNQMTEVGSGITPVTAVMSIGLKQGFVWSDQTLGDFSENTIMREARVAVVACEDEPAVKVASPAEPLEGNLNECRQPLPPPQGERVRAKVPGGAAKCTGVWTGTVEYSAVSDNSGGKEDVQGNVQFSADKEGTWSGQATFIFGDVRANASGSGNIVLTVLDFDGGASLETFSPPPETPPYATLVVSEPVYALHFRLDLTGTPPEYSPSIEGNAVGQIDPKNPNVLSGKMTLTPNPGRTITTTWNLTRK